MSKKIVPLDKNARVIIDKECYTLQYRRTSKGSVATWRTTGYFSDLKPLCQEYLNSAPQRSENAMRNVQKLIETIREAEENILQFLIKHI